MLEKLRKVFVVAIAGDSGSGKTTFAKGIENIFGDVTTITLDDYHRYDREQRRKLGITPLNPEANDLELARKHIEGLKRGEKVLKPTYDHRTGTFGEWEVIEPSPIVVVEGLHALYDGIRDVVDFGIFVDPAREVKRVWKIRRDVHERGYAMEEVVKEIIAREPDYKRFVDFQKIYADVVIKIYPSSIVTGDRLKFLLEREETYRVRLIFREIGREKLKLNLDLADAIAAEKDFSLTFYSDYYYGKRASFVEIDGFVSVEIVESLFDSLRREIGGRKFEIKSDYVNSIEFARLLVAWRLAQFLKSEL
ncbi:MAG: phosphoribulokinase [Archaeoglobaceae archaeon]